MVDSSDADAFPAKFAELAERPTEVVERRRSALEFGRRHFDQGRFVEAFDDELRSLVAPGILV